MEKPKPVELPVRNDDQGEGVGRRRVLQGLLAGVGAAIPRTAAPAEPPARPAAAHAAAAKARAADWRPEFLDAHQFATLTFLCDTIVPGSVANHTDRFLDAMLALGSHEDKQRIVSALGA